jgi:hypothetical protein
MEKEQLEIHRTELNIYNFNLSSDAVVKKARGYDIEKVL